MMRRVRKGKLRRDLNLSIVRLRIPRKGRIRLILAILLLAVGLKLFLGRKIKEPQAVVGVPPTRSVSTEGKDSHSAFRFFFSGIFKSRAAVKSIDSHSVFSQVDIPALLNRHSPDFLTTCDTVSDKGAVYVFHYSLDTGLQRSVEKLIARYHPKYGAVIGMNPVTGRVIAMVSYTREGEKSVGNNLYCRSIFPAASVFKTVTAAGAMEKAGIKPDSPFPLYGRRYTLYKSQLVPDLKYSQDVSLEDAFSMSMNPIFGRIGIYVLGISGLKEYMRKFGFNSPIPFDIENEKPVADENISDSILTIAETASGFNRITKISPLFGALIASTVSEKGEMPIPTLVDSITTTNSPPVYKASHGILRKPVMEITAIKLKNLMSNVVQHGTARKAFSYIRRSSCFDGIEYGGKTGSVDEMELGKIDWFIGFARNPDNPAQRIAVGIVTVHDEYWTVHSSFIGEEMFRSYFHGFRSLNKSKLLPEKIENDTNVDTEANE
jgi:cell division protein FtsI/penicillin-binding protein 2